MQRTSQVYSQLKHNCWISYFRRLAVMTVEFQSNVDESSGDVFVFLLCNLIS